MENEYLCQHHNLFNYKNNSYAVLNLYCCSEEGDKFRELYESHIKKHNEKMVNDKFPDSGFDLLVPTTVEFTNLYESVFINMKVKGEMFYYENGDSGVSSAFYMYPRSSISKLPLMMSNHCGVIDMGYRGDLTAAFRYLYHSPLCITYEFGSKVKTKFVVTKGSRLVQICHPSLCPIFVNLIYDPTQLSSTERNIGGFGSTS